MKQNIKNIFIFAILLLTVTFARAEGNVNIITPTNGTITSSINGTTVTLTATPDAGYYITAKFITVEKTVDGSMAGVRRHAPGISEYLTVTATDPNADSTKVTTYTFELPAGYDAEVTAEFQEYIAVENYSLKVNNVLITVNNKQDVLGDGDIDNNVAPTVFYNSQTNTMVLTKATDLDIQCYRSDSLRIYLLDSNTGKRIVSHNGDCKLIFTTDGVFPGELTLSDTDDQVVRGFASTKLAYYIQAEGLDTNKGYVKVLLKPITNDRTEYTPIDDILEAEANQIAQQDPNENVFINVIKNDFLYTYDINSESGPDPAEKAFIINKSTSFQDVIDALALLKTSYIEYSKKVCGISCILPPGEILLSVDAVCFGDAQLCLGIEGTDPMVITPDSVYKILLTKSTPAVLFATIPQNKSNIAPDHRIGRKTSAGVGFHSVSLTPTQVNSENTVSSSAPGYPESTLSNAAQVSSNDTYVTEQNTIEVIDQKTAEEEEAKGGGSTGITPPNVIIIDLRKTAEPVYDLQGRLVTYPYKPGVYISQGKKIVIK